MNRVKDIYTITAFLHSTIAAVALIVGVDYRAPALFAIIFALLAIAYKE